MFTARHVGPAALAAALASFTVPAHAAMVSYYLSQTNIESVLADGVNYARVDIDDDTPNRITFNVTLLASLTSIAGSNFGIDEFAFNIIGHTEQTPLVLDSSANPGTWGLPANWMADVAPPPNQADGFGRFDVSVNKAPQALRISPLSFALIGTGLSINSFQENSTNNDGVQPPVFFSAHIAGFTVDGSTVTSGYFGGSTLVAVVPLPATLPLVFSGLMALGTLGFGRRHRGAN